MGHTVVKHTVASNIKGFAHKFARKSAYASCVNGAQGFSRAAEKKIAQYSLHWFRAVAPSRVLVLVPDGHRVQAMLPTRDFQ